MVSSPLTTLSALTYLAPLCSQQASQNRDEEQMAWLDPDTATNPPLLTPTYYTSPLQPPVNHTPNY